jgi:tRNA pseudouridine13 synthase
MKLKRLVEDFQVVEQISLLPGSGPFALYRLTKQSLGTLEAINAIVRRWNLSPGQLAFAGLKDKHALTTQYLTIHRGVRRGLSQSNLELEYVGQVSRPIHARDIVLNRFEVVIRDLTTEEVASAETAIAVVTRDGLPNYFDSQRFGSLGQSGEFIAKPWCLGDYERTLWLALAEPNDHDRPEDRKEKVTLREHWGDWRTCMDLVQHSPWPNIIEHLARHPRDFRRSIALVPQELRSIWLAAFQSHLWNQILARLIREICEPQQCSFQRIAQRDVPFFAELNDEQRERLQSVVLPLPSARLHLDSGPLKSLYDEVLAAEGMELRQVRVKYPRDSFFSKGDRAAIFRPGELDHQFAVDELYDARQKLTLRFTLPRGSYATILVKRIVGNIGDEMTGDD